MCSADQGPGKPDFVLKKYKAVVFINGCFWHGHECHLFKWPSSNAEFWQSKISANKLRDNANRLECQLSGFRVATVWECSIKGIFKEPFDHVVGELCCWLLCTEPEFEIRGSTH